MMMFYQLQIILQFAILNSFASSKAFHPAKKHRGLQALFTPCPAPKFDVFLDSILGSWKTTTTSSADSTATSNTAEIVTGTVEEVMRSCGGAIQGMKEIQYPNTPFDQMYHNRADDGFVFFECGSYITGPTTISVEARVRSDQDRGDDNDTFSLVSSLSFPPPSAAPNLKRRVLVATHVPQTTISLTKESVLSSMSSSDGDSNKSPQLDSQIFPQLEIQDECPVDHNDIKWDEEILCKMASSTQPWMLQRAKWQRYKPTQNHNDGNDDNDDRDDVTTPSCCWIQSCTISTQNDNGTNNLESKMISSSEAFKTFISANTNIDHVIQIGAIVEKDIKAFVRCYNEEGLLRGVIFQCGKILVE